MKKTIYKYPLEVKGEQRVFLPIGSEILTIQAQFGEPYLPYLWALVDPNTKVKECKVIEIFDTGRPIIYDMGISRKYISTFQMKGGNLVFHAFEIID